MRLTPFSYTNSLTAPTWTYYLDGTTSSTPYRAVIPAADNEFINPATPSYTKRTSGYYPDLSGKEMSGATLSMVVYTSTATVGDGHDALKAAFDTQDQTPRYLICKDADNSDVQMYVTGFPKSIDFIAPKVTKVTLALVSPIWQTVALYDVDGTSGGSAVWAVTSTGATKTVTVNQGNLYAVPIISVAIGTSPATGFSDSAFVKTWNRTDKAATGYHTLLQTIDTQQTEQAGGWVADSSRSNLINNGAGISAVATTIPIDNAVGGGLPGVGMGFMVDAGKLEQISWTANSGTSLTGVTRAIGGTGTPPGTGYTHADNVKICMSHVKADLSDMRVKYNPNGVGNAADIPYWTGTVPSATTKIWANLAYKKNSDFVVATGGITDVATTLNAERLTYAESLNIAKTDGLLLCESELISYETFTKTAGAEKGVFSGLNRGVFGTTAAAHAAFVDVHPTAELRIFSGNKDLTAPTTQDNSGRPIFNLDNSTNATWIYETMRDTNYSKAYQWQPFRNVAKAIPYGYQSSHSNGPPIVQPVTIYPPIANPSLQMGITFLSGCLGTAYWEATFPFGLLHDGANPTLTATTVYRFGTALNKIYLQTYADATTLSDQVAVAENTVSNWASTATLTLTGSSTAPAFRARFYGNVARTAIPRTFAADIETITCYLSALTNSTTEGVPYVVALARTANTYNLSAVITNTTPVFDIAINMELSGMKAGDVLEIDTAAKTVTVVNGGKRTPRFEAISWNGVRAEWFPLFQGANALQYDEVGVTNNNISVSWRGRNN